MNRVHISLIVLALVALYLMYGRSNENKQIEQETTEEIIDGLLDDFGDIAASHGY